MNEKFTEDQLSRQFRSNNVGLHTLSTCNALRRRLDHHEQHDPPVLTAPLNSSLAFSHLTSSSCLFCVCHPLLPLPFSVALSISTSSRVREVISAPERKENLGAVQDRGFHSERGWRSGRKPPEKERWVNYASEGGVTVGRQLEMFKPA